MSSDACSYCERSVLLSALYRTGDEVVCEPCCHRYAADPEVVFARGPVDGSIAQVRREATDLGMTPAEAGAYIEQEVEAREAAALEAERDG